MKILLPPLGYRYRNDEKVYADNEGDVLEACLSLSDDPGYQEAVKNDTHKSRLKELKKMGFEVMEEEDWEKYKKTIKN